MTKSFIRGLGLATLLSAAGCSATGDPAVDEPVESAESRVTATAGALDPSYPATCVDTTARFTVTGAVRAVLQADGALVTATTATNEPLGAVFGLVRFSTSGKVDTGFGTAGYATTSWPGSVAFLRLGGLALAPDEKVVVAGTAATVITDASGAMSQPDSIAVARYTKNGALDESFGKGGRVSTAIFGRIDRANVVLVQPDGKILVGGETRPNLTGYKGTNITALVRYQTSGALDPSFGQGGVVTVATGRGVTAMALEANGNIFVATPELMRFTSGGAPITAPFAGTLTTIAPGQFGALALASDGKRITGGGVRSPTNKHARFPTVSRVAVNGTVEFTTPGFNYGSPVMGSTAVLEALLVEPSGRIIAGGRAILPGSSETGFGLAAIQPTGTIDAAFGGPTGLSTRISGQDAVHAVVQQSDAKLVAVGICANGIGLARYIGP